MRLSGRRPSPAMVVACLALFVALAGTSVAAVSQLVPRNSVGTVQLRNSAVTNPKLRNNAITTAKVRNRSLLAADFAPGQLVPGPTGPAGPTGAPGPAGPAGTGAALAFRFVAGPAATSTSSTSYVELPTASASIDVPAGTTATILVSFAAESSCYGAGYCSVRVLVDGNEATPVVGTNEFAFDSSDGGTETSSSWESHALERAVTGVAAGAHTVTVQYATTSATGTFRLDDWGLTVLAMRQS